jgi:hypothetical protein
MKITSTSNKTNKIATKKYLIEKGVLASPWDSIPHSKASDLILEFFLGPRACVATIDKTINPTATTNMNRIVK